MYFALHLDSEKMSGCASSLPLMTSVRRPSRGASIACKTSKPARADAIKKRQPARDHVLDVVV